MQRVHLLLTNLLPAVLDFGVGAFLAVLILSMYGESIPAWAFLAGGLLALLPDMDIVPSILSGESTPFDHHQTYFHRPVLMLIMVGTIGYWLAGAVWALIAILCLVWHFLHDTGWLSTSSGIAWLWPASNKFISWYGLYVPVKHPDHHGWLKLNWCRPTLLSVSEISLGIVLLYGALLLSGIQYAYFLPSLLVVLTATVWGSAAWARW